MRAFIDAIILRERSKRYELMVLPLLEWFSTPFYAMPCLPKQQIFHSS